MNLSLPEETAARGRDLVSRFIREISEAIGPPDHPIGAIEVSVLNHGPALSVGDDGQAVVYVGPNAVKHEPVFVANLAHESVHLHEWTTGYASGLEEGFAVAFELAALEVNFGMRERRHFENHMPRTYVRALHDYFQFISLEPDGLRKTRRLYGKLSGPTARQLRYAFPKIGWLRSYRLARRVRMR